MNKVYRCITDYTAFTVGKDYLEDCNGYLVDDEGDERTNLAHTILIEKFKDVTPARAVEEDGCCLTEPKPPSTMHQAGVKADDTKPDWSLLPLGAVEEVVKVMDFGAKKYTRNGWKTLPDAENRYLAAMFRHIKAHRDGEVLDDESGLPHMAHAATCLLFLLEK